MRSSIGGTWLIGLMLGFIAIFSAFVVLMINYSKTVKIKDESLSIIEKYQGLNANSFKILNNYLTTSGYNAKGVCVDNQTGSYNGVYGSNSISKDNINIEPAQTGKKYYYCIKKYRVNRAVQNSYQTKTYYQISVFYKFNLPILGDSSGFIVRGTTTSIIAYDEQAFNKAIGD